MQANPLQETPPTLHINGAVATITLCRPAHHNRLHAEDLGVLRTHFRTINANTALRVLVFTAQVQATRPVFCAGYHIGQHGGEHPDATFEQVADDLEALRVVTICALNGSVYGGATDLVLACDFAIGLAGTQARMPAAALGLHYYPGGISRFVSRLGLPNAKRAFLGADTLAADELLRIGFVQQLAPDAAAHQAAVQARVAGLLAHGPLALQLLKTSLNEVARGDFNAERLRARMHATQASNDFAEARAAFAARRAPAFTGS